ncbi:hypothetical protein [Litoreibacter roseus]|uniref:VPLPA-CTERM protein sorting domain-containing protein n=1 Tax=Litoreibacter roseus TaxID=2601869 RepID=A0A6N6JBX0_9RHOB|nr:hypothetical protein [Litoreibacter roseus]GFE63793.1 hypothetical protein KIN_08670 [Litoreibacter roseus]
MFFTRFSAMVGTLVLVPCLATAAPVVFSASGPDAASIQAEVDEFRDALGALNPNEPENFEGGRRQINWDAAPDAISDPNAFPGDFFNFNSAPRARGIEFRPTEREDLGPDRESAEGFQLSSTEASGEPIRFGLEESLGIFSPERLFAPIGGTVFDVFFFDPSDQTTPAGSLGLGIVFTNVKKTESGTDAKVDFFKVGQDVATDTPEFTAFAPESGPGGLSFLGVLFEEPVLGAATVSAGFHSIDDSYFGSQAVAMDDFIFGEPIPQVAPVPVPASAVLLGSALLGGGAVARSRRRKKA